MAFSPALPLCTQSASSRNPICIHSANRSAGGGVSPFVSRIKLSIIRLPPHSPRSESAQPSWLDVHSLQRLGKASVTCPGGRSSWALAIRRVHTSGVSIVHARDQATEYEKKCPDHPKVTRATLYLFSLTRLHDRQVSADRSPRAAARFFWVVTPQHRYPRRTGTLFEQKVA